MVGGGSQSQSPEAQPPVTGDFKAWANCILAAVERRRMSWEAENVHVHFQFSDNVCVCVCVLVCLLPPTQLPTTRSIFVSISCDLPALYICEFGVRANFDLS